MLSRAEWRRFWFEVGAGLVSAGLLWFIAFLLSARLSAVVLGFGVVASVVAMTSTIAWLRERRRAGDFELRLADAETGLERSRPEIRLFKGRAEEAERRAAAAEARYADAENHARAAEESARHATVERREAEAAYDAVKKWEQLESYTGLTDYWQELDGSDQHPREKLSEISSNLDFMGHGGSKWTAEREQFSEMLGRIGNSKGTARMLLLNPECEISRKKSLIRSGRPDELPRKIASSLVVIDELRQTYDNLQVRVYSHMPHFRLTIADRRVAIVGHYRSYDRDSSRSPLLAWENATDWSFFISFVAYFEHEWDVAAEVDWDSVRELSTPWNRV